ncbi:hypothetical protein AS188_03130 [Kocuria flava]|uniref:Transposase DDE domain-containing protein n=1 Tax=Kocuria flava TaxID=446860 RepID=A0A0U3HVG1_9MICC|nr:hypothetical protein [Kocuria flava]ALU38903.1 hypothetical protein AS188_03130 [Kocuria flava]GEO93369.1 hypothetical protein KFL01_26750 [Kocuria flava]
MGHVEVTVWLAVGYALFLLAAAFGVDQMARRAAARAAAWHHGGFTYHADHDAWQCPQDHWLWPQSFDPDNRVMRYRASPTVCNACPVKSTCTTSPHGRQIGRNVDPWPASEAERFHRGIACAVAVLAVAWPLAMMLEHRTPTELVVLGGAVVLVALSSWPLWSHLRRSPAGFPVGVKVETLDDTVAGRTAAPPIRYRSDRSTADRPGEQTPTGRSRGRNR